MSIKIKKIVEIPEKEMDKIFEELDELRHNVFFGMDSPDSVKLCENIIAQLRNYMAPTEEFENFSTDML